MWVCLTSDRGPTQVGFESVQISLGKAHGFVNIMSKENFEKIMAEAAVAFPCPYAVFS